MELENLLLDIILKSAAYRDGWHFSFKLMYATGCRHEETRSVHWSVLSSDCVMLMPIKHGKARMFTREALGDEIFFAIINSELNKYFVPRSTLTRAFMLLSFPYRIYRISEMTFLHAFRYAYVFRLVDSGLDLQAIQIKMGHNDSKNTQIYMSKVIKIVKL